MTTATATATPRPFPRPDCFPVYCEPSAACPRHASGDQPRIVRDEDAS